MISTESWHNSITQAINECQNVTSVWSNKQRINYGMTNRVEVEFEGAIDTSQVLSIVEPPIATRTRVGLCPEQETIQFRFENKTQVSELRGTELIDQILTDDFFTRSEYSIKSLEWEIEKDTVTVQSPSLIPIQLFENIVTNFWVCSNITVEDNVVSQKFTQYDLSEMSEEAVIDKYGMYRLESILWSVETECPICSGIIKIRPQLPFKESDWIWRCEDCERVFAEQKIELMFDGVNPLWSRERIIQNFESKASSILNS